MGLPMSDLTAWATAMNNLGMAPMGMAGQPLLPDFDPALGMMTGIPPINPMMPGLGIVPPPNPPDMPAVKEIIHCKSCTLFPPNPNLPPPATRERPPGCKTVFVGGLPENGTEQIIVEVFEQCGEIIAIRKSKKNFCHIRFAEEFMVDKALYLSGYRIRLGSSTDKKDTGRLHVDFAQARDDLYEWECKQRMLAREERHRRRMEEERFCPPSPPPVVHYSDHECSIVAEKLKDDSKFLEAVQTLVTWIERGEVNRRSANNFYSMIQSANSHIRRLMNEKAAHEKEMEEAKEKFKLALSGILVQFEQIVAVYHSASKQKAWDHFTKAQRKNISVWCKQAEEIRNIHNDELMGIRREEEMEMSDDELEDPSETKETEESALISQAEALKEENDSLRWQLDAYRNEVELLKQEQGKVNRDEDTTREQQLKLLQQALQGMQQVRTQGLSPIALHCRRNCSGINHMPDCLRNLCHHFTHGWHSNTKLAGSEPVAIWDSQLPDGYSNLLLHQQGHPHICVFMLQSWGKLLTELLKCSFLHVNVLEPLLVVLGLQDNLVPPVCAYGFAPKALVYVAAIPSIMSSISQFESAMSVSSFSCFIINSVRCLAWVRKLVKVHQHLMKALPTSETGVKAQEVVFQISSPFCWLQLLGACRLKR
uniref:RRM domain-containing protein n=1 Tax=Gopherus agassizii TaxID=38772 RepID=A0A452H8B0_9SAUR